MAHNRRRRTTDNSHTWTDFEKHTLLCLMAKGMHLEGRGKRSDEPGVMRRHAYLNVATELNKAVHGEKNYGKDIDKKEVAKMIDKMLVEKKGVVGKGGYMERATRGRITRGLKRMWEREPSFDYDGSKSEWKQWRKESEAEKRRVAAGGAPKESGGIVQSIESDGGEGMSGTAHEDIWRSTDIAPSNRSALTNDRNQAPPTSAQRPSVPTTFNYDSFTRLPARLRGNEKFAWADPGRPAQNRSSYSGPPNIDSYRPSTSSTSRDSSHQPSKRYKSMIDSYRPPIHDDYRPSSSSYHFSDKQSQSMAQNERFDFHSDAIASTPSLVPDYSSSPAKLSTYSGTARSYASRSIAAQPSNSRNTHEDARLAQSIQYEMSQRRSSEYKKPGILKNRPVLNDSGDRGDCTPSDGINPARRAMLAEGGDEEMSYERMEQALRPVVKGANKEDLPFNRLESLRRGSGGSEVEMGEGGYY